MKINKIFISGAAGFVGSHLSEFLFKNFSESEFILFDKLTKSQTEAVDSSLMRQSDARMPLFKESKSSTSFGKGS